jgi:hypothetical protein
MCGERSGEKGGGNRGGGRETGEEEEKVCLFLFVCVFL